MAKQRYSFTGATIEFPYGGKTITLHQIRAEQTFNIDEYHGISCGDIGGWIEKESNLKQEGQAWIGKDAYVFGDAVVSGKAFVFGKAKIHGHASVKGNARVFAQAEVSGKATVCGDAQVYGRAKIYGKAKIDGKAQVYDDAKVYDEAHVTDEAEVNEEASVYGQATLKDLSKSYGHSEVFGTTCLSLGLRAGGNMKMGGKK